jgi:hypothetical protein
MNPMVINVLKGAGAALATGVVGVTAYKAVQHFTGNKDSTDSGSVVTETVQSTPQETTLEVQKLTEYPSFVTSAFPNLEIREAEVFQNNGIDFLLVEGTDNKMSTPRPQAILFKLDGNMYKMIQSVTVTEDKVSYSTREDLGVNIAYENNGNVQSFTGSGSDQPIPNFNNDFVLAI